MLCARQVAATSARLVAGLRPRMAIAVATRTVHTDPRRWWSHIRHGRLLWWCYHTARRAFQYASPVRPNPRLLFCGMAVFLWDRERIPVEDVMRCLEEYENRLCWQLHSEQRTVVTTLVQEGETSVGVSHKGGDRCALEDNHTSVSSILSASEEEGDMTGEEERLAGSDGLGIGTSDLEDDDDNGGLGTQSSDDGDDPHEAIGVRTNVVELVPVDNDGSVGVASGDSCCYTGESVEVSKDHLLRAYEDELGVGLGTTSTNWDTGCEGTSFTHGDGDGVTSGLDGGQVDCTPGLATPYVAMETPSDLDDVLLPPEGPLVVDIPHDREPSRGQEGQSISLQQKDPLSGWELMVEQDNCKVYKTPYGEAGLNKYKVIGTYDDITAKDFLDIQVDHEARKEWDNYVVKLETVDTDPTSGCEVIHWVMKYPFPMQNREYVYVRKFWVNRTENAIVLINKSVTHPKVPESRRYVRVHTYFSEMVIKPYSFIDELGFDFELTYFDDPQSYLPSSCVNWVTTTGMPDFLNQMHNAALNRIAGDEKKQNIGL